MKKINCNKPKKNKQKKTIIELVDQYKIMIGGICAVLFFLAMFYITFAATELSSVLINTTGNISAAGDLVAEGQVKLGPDVETADTGTYTVYIQEDRDFSTPTDDFYPLKVKTNSYGLLDNSGKEIVGILAEITEGRAENGNDAYATAIRGLMDTGDTAITFRRLRGVDGTVNINSTAVSDLDNADGGYFYAATAAPNAMVNRIVGVRGVARAYTGSAGINIASGGVFTAYSSSGGGTINEAIGVEAGSATHSNNNVLTSYGIIVRSRGATVDNYGIYGESGDWVLVADGDGLPGGVVDPNYSNPPVGSGDIVLGADMDAAIWYDGTNMRLDPDVADTNSEPQVEVDGGVRLNTGISKPVCSASLRGTMWFTNNGAAADDIEVCLWNGAAYAWVSLQ